MLQTEWVQLNRADLTEQLDAIAHLLAQGAEPDDRVGWSAALEARVDDAARRFASRVDWDGADTAATDGAQWTRSTLIELVQAHIDHARGALRTRPTASRVSIAATRAADEWERHTVAWIPEPVTEIVYSTLTDDGDRAAALREARAIVNIRRAARATAEARRRREEEQKRAAAAEEEARRQEAIYRQAQELARARQAAVEAAARAREAAEARRVAEAERLEALRVAEELAEAERLEAQRLAEEQRLEAQRLAEQRAEAERLEALRVAEQLAEAERLEAIRVAEELAEAERLEALRVAAQLAEAVRLEALRVAEELAEAERQERWLNRPAPAPEPQPFGVSHEGAERLCAAWMRHLGVLDAEVTRFTGDGGIDITSEHYVAQVKNYAGSVAVTDIRALFGVATAEHKRALLFTSGAVTTEGIAFAERTGMALLRYDAVEGTIVGLNDLGAQCVEHSIPEATTAGATD